MLKSSLWRFDILEYLFYPIFIHTQKHKSSIDSKGIIPVEISN